MKRVNLNFIVDVVAFAGFVLLTTTGVLKRYILPPGSGHYSTICEDNGVRAYLFIMLERNAL